jgi:hypothetical protein
MKVQLIFLLKISDTLVPKEENCKEVPSHITLYMYTSFETPMMTNGKSSYSELFFPLLKT